MSTNQTKLCGPCMLRIHGIKKLKCAVIIKTGNLYTDKYLFCTNWHVQLAYGYPAHFTLVIYNCTYHTYSLRYILSGTFFQVHSFRFILSGTFFHSFTCEITLDTEWKWPSTSRIFLTKESYHFWLQPFFLDAKWTLTTRKQKSL